MNNTFLKQFSYLFLIGCSFIQVGASLFAISVNVSTLVKAPPASLAMVQGSYVFDPSVFWDNFPNFMLVVVILTLILNWKTPLRKWIIWGSVVYLISGIIAVFILEPVQTEFLSSEYANIIDPVLKEQGILWRNVSLCFLGVSILSGLVFILGYIKVQLMKTSN